MSRNSNAVTAWQAVVFLGILFLQMMAALAQYAPSSGARRSGGEPIISIQGSTQWNMGDLSIGASNVLTGPYLDERNHRHYGLHATLTFAVDGNPAQFRQLDVAEGQMVDAAGRRFMVDKIDPEGQGSVVLRTIPRR